MDAPNWLLPAISLLVTVVSFAYMAGRLTGTYATKEDLKEAESKLRDKIDGAQKESAVIHQGFVSRKEFEESEKEFKEDIKEIKATMQDVKDTLIKFVARFNGIKSAGSNS